MEYRARTNLTKDGSVFFEDKKTGVFGLKVDDGNEIKIKIKHNQLAIDGTGANVYLVRNNKSAKISPQGKKITGVVMIGDKLYLSIENSYGEAIGNSVEIEFLSPKIKVIQKLEMPKINISLWSGILVLLMLLVIVFVGWKRNTQAKTENDYQTAMKTINEKIAAAETIKSIDPNTAVKLLGEAKLAISSVKNNKIHQNETNDKETQINSLLASVGSTDIVPYDEIYDTKAADTTDRAYDKVAVQGSEATLVDSKSNKALTIDLVNKSFDKKDIDSKNNVIDIGYYAKAGYILGENKIVSIKDPNSIIVFDSNNKYIKMFNWNKVWYLLSENGQVDKLSDSKVMTWTSETADKLTDVVSMVIDGSVWVINKQGDVIKYDKGLSNKWATSNKITDETIVGISTVPEIESIVIATNKSVYVYKKTNGQFVSKYNFEKVGIVDAKMGSGGQIYVLGQDQKIYKVK